MKISDRILFFPMNDYHPCCTRSLNFRLFFFACCLYSFFKFKYSTKTQLSKLILDVLISPCPSLHPPPPLLLLPPQLLLSEISGLEQQVATFRGYADQRHVTVLALRDERQRNREIAAELSSHADAASAVSHMVTAGRRARRRSGSDKHDDEGSDDEEDDACRLTGSSIQLEGISREESLATDAPVAAAAAAAAEALARAGTAGALSGGTPSSPRGATVTAAERLAGAAASQKLSSSESARDCDERGEGGKNAVAAEAAGGGGEGERASLETIRKALADAANELSRRGAAFEVERDARVAVQSRVKEADRLTRAAELRAEASEAAAAKVRGRVSVLERNVEYLQGQQRALR